MSRGPIKRQTLAVLRQRQVPVATVLDVGVLTGTPELLEAYPDRLHLLFEPVAEFAPLIEQAYRMTPHRLIQAAVSDSSGQTLLETYDHDGGAGIAHSAMTADAARARRTVQMVSLDEFLRANPAPAPFLLKVDIDGQEMKVLRGAAETLRQTSIVVVEVTTDAIVERLGFLLQAGFRLFDLTEPCYYDDGLWQCDAVLVRNDLYPQYFATYDRGLDMSKFTVFRQ